MIRSTGSTRGRLARVAPWGALLALVVPLTLTGCSSASPAVENTYGGVPSYLAKIPSATDRVLTGTTAKPALTSEGDAVRMRLADGGSLLATVTGPVVPGEGLPYQGETTTCTWTVTLRDASETVPIDLGDMTTIDQLGNVYSLSPVPSRPAPPTIVSPGSSVTFELRTDMKVGEGVLRWGPGGTAPVAEWDFEVEND